MNHAGVPATPSEYSHGTRAVDALKWAVVICTLVLIIVSWAATLAVLVWWIA